MSASKINWLTHYDIRWDRFIIQAFLLVATGEIRTCYMWVWGKDLKKRGRIAAAIRRIQRALIKDLERRNAN